MENIEELRDQRTENNAILISKEKLISRYTYVAWSLVGIGGIIFVLALFIGDPRKELTAFENLNTNYSGIISAIWALAGLFFIYVAFLGQQKQIILQSEEIQLNRIDVKATIEELKGQKNQMERQNFETTFFKLIGFLNSIIQDMDVLFIKRDLGFYDPDRKVTEEDILNGKQVNGRDCFKVIYENHFRHEYYHAIRNIPDDHELTRDENLKLINQAFGHTFNKYQSDLGTYFRNLYNILKYLDESNVKKEDKAVYSNLLRAQLSSYELLILFYNGLSERGESKFRPLMENYELLKDMPSDAVLRKDHLQYYTENVMEK